MGPPEAALNDPWLLPDAGLVRSRIALALERGERALVFGDFDADGLTGLAIMVLALRDLGLDVAPYVPDRRAEGHGLSRFALERARAEGRTLIVTVDTGTSNVAEVAEAAAAGIDVIVTDHHHVPERLPDAVACVNPHRPTSNYPDPRLAGTGVAFKVAQLLLADQPGGAAAALALADLATIGTVADVAPIVGENRAIARLGLVILRTHPRPGLAALLAAANVAPGRVDLDTIGYAIAPRLNAGGRVADAETAAHLLLAASAAEAAPLAAELEAANLLRREMTATALVEARLVADMDPGAAAVVIAGDWPVGIIGLVAGRLAEERGRPAVVVSNSSEPWRGSARSAGGFDLARAFDACAPDFERHGGHPQAAGCNLREGRFEGFRARFLALAAEAAPGDVRPELRLDLALDALEIDYRLHADLGALEPTGPGNPRPLLGIAGLILGRARPAKGGHTQLTLRKGREVIDAIAFDRPSLSEELAEGDPLDVVARLTSRSFGGYETLQLEICDVAPHGTLERLQAVGTALPA